MTHPVTSSDGTRLAVREWGSRGKPVVVLVHGLGLSTHSWGHLPELLAPDLHVIAYDLRGHHKSETAASGDYRLAAQAADLAAVLERAVPAGPPVVLVGHSLGGAVILAHARAVADGHFPAADDGARHPRVVAAVFVGSSGSSVRLPGLPSPGLPLRLQAWIRVAWLKLLHLAALLGRRISAVRVIGNWLARITVFTADSPSPLVEQARNDFFSTDPKVLARTALASVSVDGTALAPALEVPTLVLRGELDREASAEDVAELLADLPDGELVTLPGAGHMITLTHSETVAEHIRHWAARFDEEGVVRSDQA